MKAHNKRIKGQPPKDAAWTSLRCARLAYRLGAK